jgi:hypothetical protein
MDFTVQAKPFTREQIADVLCSALDAAYGSSYYWIEKMKKVSPTSWEFDSEPRCEEGKHYRQDYPLNPGGALLISDEDNKDFRLDLNAIQRGLGILASKYPHHFADIIAGNADADTGDALVQCCLFGDIIYG